MKARKYYGGGLRPIVGDTVPRTVAGARRAWRKRQRRLVRREAQLREAQRAQADNLAVALASRDRNAGMAIQAQGILDQSRSRKARIVAAQVAQTRKLHRLLLASLSASLLLLGYSAWSVIR